MTPAIAAFRAAHVAVAIIELWALAWVWICALTRRRGRALVLAVGLLLAEGFGLAIGRGNCPFGPFQRRLGDPVPLFEFVLPPRAAKAAIPLLFGVTMAGLAALLVRPPTTATGLMSRGSRGRFGHGWSGGVCMPHDQTTLTRGSDSLPPEPDAAWRTARDDGPGEQPAFDAVAESDDVDAQSEQSFPASDPPSWSGVSI